MSGGEYVAYRSICFRGWTRAGSTSSTTVDRRPLSATVSAAPGTQPVAVLAVSEQLMPSELEVLQKAVSASYLKERGLRESSHGEIVNEPGRTVFDAGFARAIRKVLGT